MGDSGRMWREWYCSRNKDGGLPSLVVCHGEEGETQTRGVGTWGSGGSVLPSGGVTMSCSISESHSFPLTWPCSVTRALRTECTRVGETEDNSVPLTALLCDLRSCSGGSQPISTHRTSVGLGQGVVSRRGVLWKPGLLVLLEAIWGICWSRMDSITTHTPLISLESRLGRN